jgi:hypothetical protein
LVQQLADPSVHWSGDALLAELLVESLVARMAQTSAHHLERSSANSLVEVLVQWLVHQSEHSLVASLAVRMVEVLVQRLVKA